MDHRRRFSAHLAHGRDPRSTILGAIDFARDFIGGAGLSERSGIKLAIIVEELVSNALRHRTGEQDIAVWLTLEEADGEFSLQIEDDGEPFDPTTVKHPNSPNPSSGGGIGLTIVRAWGEDITYTRRGDHNCLSLVIR